MVRRRSRGAPLARLLIASALAGAASACAPALPPSLRASGDALRAPARAVTAADAVADLAVAVRAFREAYAAPEGDAPVPPAARIEATRARLSERAVWPPPDLARELLALFARRDGHLAIGWAPDAAARALPVAPPPAPADRPPFELNDGAVPVLTVRTFAAAAAPALRALPGIARQLRERPAFVLDLRGNAGGDHALAEPIALELASAPLTRLGEREVVSAEAAEGRANLVAWHLAGGAVPRAAEPLLRARLAQLEADAARLRGLAARRAEIVTAPARVAGRAARPLAGAAVVLVDAGCASACEMLVAELRQIPGVVVAGAPTRGAMAVGETALFVLPRSGLVIRLGTRAFTDPSGDFREGRGFVPDVPIAGPAAVARARAIASVASTTAAAPAR